MNNNFKPVPKILFFSVFCLLFSVFCTSAFAAIPHLINYQGRLTDSSGAPLNGSYNISFSIYDAENAGSLLWKGAYSGVAVTKGIFNILLGDVNDTGYNFQNLSFDKPYWLEIKVGDDNPMTPRQRITSAGYAIRAEKLSEPVDLTNDVKGILPVDKGGTGKNTSFIATQAVGVTDIQASSSETDMPDMTITVTTTGTRLLCMFSAPFYNNSGGGYPANIALYINVDGNNVRTFKTTSVLMNSAGWNSAVSFQHLVTGLSPGSHTVKIKWVKIGSHNIQQRGTSDSERILTVIDLP